MEKITNRRAEASMGANNNNNNSYGNSELNGLRRRQPQSSHWQQVAVVAAAADERAAALVEGRLAGGAVGQEPTPQALISLKNKDNHQNQNQNQVQHGTEAAGENSHMVMAIISLEKSNRQSGMMIQKTPINSRHNHTQMQAHNSHRRSKTSLFVVTILLPFLLVFLLPFSSDDHLQSPQQQQQQQQQHETKSIADHLTDSQQQLLDPGLLLSLLRLPLDRFRLSSGYSMMMLASAKEIVVQAPSSLSSISAGHHPRLLAANADLQEEETHMVVMAPEQQQRQPSGYQLAPIRQAPSAYGGGGEQDSYGHDYGSANHANLLSANEAASSADGGAGGDPTASAELMPASASGSVVAPSGGGGSAAAQRTDLPSVRALNVKCEKNHMTVNIVFDRPFYGMVFSKGHYNDQKCVHLPPNSGQTSINFDIHLGKCGMSSSSDPGTAAAAAAATNSQQQALQQANGGQQQQPNGLFIENTIIIQYDPQVQEIYDQARRLRCTWYDYYEKSVTFRPYNVDMLDAVTANFLGDNIQCWMQIQVGKGPWSSEVAGIVKIGQTMTMVLAIKDDENKFDMLVRNCVASDGKHQPIQLVDEYGCVARPKIMAKFQKVRNFGPAATVVSYAHFQAFKFPDSMSVNFQCVIQVCRYECPEPVCSAASAGAVDSIGGPSSSSSGQSAGSAQDYAASGTELISSKELLPAPASHVRAHNSSGQHHLLHGSGSAINSVNLKLDESQGRVQVKLDTSMMANTAAAAAAAGSGSNTGMQAMVGGPLPPHLLHHSGPQQPPGGHTYLSSSYYRPSLGGASAAPAASLNGRPLAPASQQMRPSAATALPPGGQHQQYSSPAGSSLLSGHHHPRPAYMMTNRMGELVAEDGPISSYAGSAAAGGEDDMIKLSLIASPRALPYAMPTSSLSSSSSSSSNHRYRRSINATTIGETPKSRRQVSGGGESTAIKTQRTIQVVSPDDMAFNLIDLDSTGSSWPHEESLNDNQQQQQQRRRTKQTQAYQSTLMDPTMVCFSAGRLITSALASAALVATLVLVAVLIIMRQRKRLNEKLSPVYDSSRASPDLMINNQSVASHHLQQQHRQRAAAAAEQMIMRRQQEEMRQRNTYLGRLYSQFVPAAHWR